MAAQKAAVKMTC